MTAPTLDAVATQYDTAVPRGSWLAGTQDTDVLASLNEVAAQEQLVGDARLARLAAFVAAAINLPENTAPSQTALQWAASAVGLVEPLPHFAIVTSNELHALGPRLLEEVRGSLSQQPHTHFGAALRAHDGLYTLVLAMSQRVVELAPVPRNVEVGETLHLRGKLVGVYRDAWFALTLPNGQALRKAGSVGTALDASFTLSKAGEYRLEILAQGPSGPTVVANMPLYVGVPAPAQAPRSAASSRVLSAEEAAKRIFELTNDAREKANVPEVAWDETLAQVALAHSQELQARGQVAHDSPTTGNAADRVLSAGMRVRVVMENLGLAYSADDVHQGLMDSPGHRANVLSPEAARMGVGVVVVRDNQRASYWVTELFVR